MNAALIVSHTPVWVWSVLAGLVVLGLVQSRPRRVSARRAALLPLGFAALSLASCAQAFPAAQALPAWALGLVAAASLAARAGAPAGARWHAAGRAFDVPGSWLPLAIMLGIFGLRFAAAVLLAVQPALRGDATFAALAGLGYGGFSGLFVGRALALARLAFAPAGTAAARAAAPTIAR